MSTDIVQLQRLSHKSNVTDEEALIPYNIHNSHTSTSLSNSMATAAIGTVVRTPYIYSMPPVP